jgi:hypothetical protein
VEVIGLQVFVSLMLVVGSILLFAFSAKQRDHEHGHRLSLLPLEEDAPRRAPTKDPEAPSPRSTGNE